MNTTCRLANGGVSGVVGGGRISEFLYQQVSETLKAKMFRELNVSGNSTTAACVRWATPELALHRAREVTSQSRSRN